ncbi:PP2C family protein-serine/threonine phosphatase [Pedobacter sp. PWIIR3]
MGKNHFGITDIGKVRSNNEDTFIAKDTAAGDYIIACVIDGVGGYSGGEIAAEIAKLSILEHLSKPQGDILSLMKQAISEADSKILAEKQQAKELENMACVLTLAMVDLSKNMLFYVHVGDTRMYLCRDNSLVKITSDQSFVGFMEDTGRLTEEEAMKHPKRNEINKALGFGVNLVHQDDYIEMGQSPFLPGDLLLICSDGLSDMVNKNEIVNALHRGKDLTGKGTNLIVAANKNGGTDNITVVLVENTNAPIKHEATKPGQPVKSSIYSQPLLFDEPELQSKNNTKEVEELPNPPLAQPIIYKSNKGLISLLVVVCLIFIASTAYLYWLYNNHPANEVKQQPLTEVTEKRNTKEIMLQDTLNKMKGQTLVLTDSLFSSPIILHQPLEVNKDTIYLKSEKELVFISDSLYKGVAINIRPASKLLQLRNIAFENFNTAIITANNALVLKNIRFTNCPNTIQSTYNLAQKKYINGKIPFSSFTADSLSFKETD